MKRLSTLSLFPAAAIALLAFGVGIAQATEIYGNGSTIGAGSTFNWSLEPGTAAQIFDTQGQTLLSCSTSTIKGKITSAGSSTTTTTASIETMTWGSCTFPTTTVKLGKLEFHHVSGGTNATVTADAEIGVTINTVFFGSCVYGTKAGTDLGIITTGRPATYHDHWVSEKLSGSSFACPETATFKAQYIWTEPSFPGPIQFEQA